MKKFLKVILPIFIVSFSLLFVACKKNNNGNNPSTSPSIETPGDNPNGDGNQPELENKIVTKIELITDVKTNYFVGDSLDDSVIQIKVTYENQTSENITITKEMISGFDTSTAGDKEVTITYKEKTTTLAYTVTPIKATAFTVNQTLKSTYYTGDEFESNITLSVTYNNSTIKNNVSLESNMISGFDTSEVGNKKFVITVEELSQEFDYEVKLLVMTGIEISTPFKTTYFVGETLDTTNGKLKLLYNSGKFELVDITKDMVLNFSTPYIKNTNMQVVYGDFSIDVPYIVKVVELVSIEITSPFKYTYYQGDELDVSGGKLTLTYNNANTEVIDITSSMVQNFSTSSSDTKTLTIYYKGKHTYAEYSVIKLVATSLELKTNFKTKYLKGETLNLDGGTIEYVLNNGQTAIIAVTEEMISGFLSTSVGTFEMSITYYSNTIAVSYEIYEITATGITLKTPFKSEYYVGDLVDTTGGEITVSYSDGTTQDISITSGMIDRFSTGLASEKTKTMIIKYKYLDIIFTIDFNYTVSERPA